jgi:hypothetical protein
MIPGLWRAGGGPRQPLGNGVRGVLWVKNGISQALLVFAGFGHRARAVLPGVQLLTTRRCAVALLEVKVS